ncbi:MAG: hypothetical protein K2N13_07145 [Paraprevotella sp.]|nr:hypothetical protein [Paraprevotella sp.]
MKRLILLLLAGTMAACMPEKEQTTPDNEQQSVQDSTSLKVALMPTLDCLPFYYAKEHDIYQTLGLEVRLLTFNSQMDCDTAFQRGHAELSYTDLVKAAALQGGGTGLYVIAQTDGGDELITSKSKRIKKLTQLKNSMIGISRNGLCDFLTDRFSDSLHLGGMDVFKPQVNDIILRTNMLCNDMLDAAFLPEPYATRARMAGHRSIYGSRQTGMNLTGLMITYRAATDSNRAAQTCLLLEGYDRAVEMMNSAPAGDDIRRLLSSVCRLQNEVTDSLHPLQLHFRTLKRPSEEQTDTVVAWLHRRKLVNKNYTGDTLFLNTFITRP